MADNHPIIVKAVDLGDAALVVCITVLIVLCVGKPDLLDAIIARLMARS